MAGLWSSIGDQEAANRWEEAGCCALPTDPLTGRVKYKVNIYPNVVKSLENSSLFFSISEHVPG